VPLVSLSTHALSCFPVQVLPSRLSQMDPQLWADAGYDIDDARRYLTAHTDSLSHPNMHVQIRTPGASTFVTLFAE
jgi:hypothetical protein